MPGFLGGSTGGSSGSGGAITAFPKEFVDPVTKLRVSNPENLIDTDFEYGLQPTKWETVELINNTPSFFSKSGDTTIPGIQSITTNAGTREITVKTALDHGLAVGIPINVTGTKSLTADGAYIINSIPNSVTFTYLCKDDQATTASIEDLYSSIITGEFFQGSQLRISDSEGVVTDGEGISTLTVKTESPHGFGVNTPFYFLNLNSTISQEFQSANNAAKSFDASNSATAQTFDGSNTLSSIPVDWSNSATTEGTPSTISAVDIDANTITVAHGVDNFSGLPIGTPLYYKIQTGVGFFASNPYGVVFLRSTDDLDVGSSTFQVSHIPNGDVVNIEASMSGTIVVANQARTFAGNNIDPATQQTVEIIKGAAYEFEGANDGGPVDNGIYQNGYPDCTVTNYSGSLVNVSVPAGEGLGYYQGAMVLYSTDGGAASGLTNNTTYFVDSFFPTGTDTFAFTIKSLPTDVSPISISGGTGTQTFSRIGVSLDKDIWHIRDSEFVEGDMLLYEFPAQGDVQTDSTERHFFVKDAYDSHNYTLADSFFSPTVGTGGTVTQIQYDGSTWNVHRFTSLGSATFTVDEIGTDNDLEYLVIGGGGGGGSDMGGGGGAGGYQAGTIQMSSTGSYSITVGDGGSGAPSGIGRRRGYEGAASSLSGPDANIIAYGGGGGASCHDRSNSPAGGVNNLGSNVGSGGGASGGGTLPNGGSGGGGYGGGIRGTGLSGQGNDGGSGLYSWYPGAGGGAGTVGDSGSTWRKEGATGGRGIKNDILGIPYYWAGGGGASGYSGAGGNGGIGGGGGGAVYRTNGGEGFNNGSSGGGGNISSQTNRPGGSGGANTGGGGGGGSHYRNNNYGGRGGSGIVVVRYRVTPKAYIPAQASGGTESTVVVGNTTYRVHQFTNVGSDTFTVSEPGNLGAFEYLIVGGGGGGGMDMGGGGGGGGVIQGGFYPTAQDYPITVGAGGNGAPRAGSGTGTQNRTTHQFNISAQAGGVSVAFGLQANGGGFGASSYFRYRPNSGRGGNGASGGGASAYSDGNQGRRGGGSSQGRDGGRNQGGQYYGGGGGGTEGNGSFGTGNGEPRGGRGKLNDILGVDYRWGGGGGSSGYTRNGGNGGVGGGGGGAVGTTTGGAGLNDGSPGGGGSTSSQANRPGGNGGANTGGGGGGGSHYRANNQGGDGGSGIVIVRYPIEINNS